MSWWCPSPISVLSAWSPVGTTLGPLSVEPWITSGPLSVDSRGYPSRSSQHPLPAREQERGPPLVHGQDEGSLPERVQLQRAQSRAGDLQSPRSLCLRDPFLKPLSFRGNRAKFQTPQHAFHRQEDAKVLCSLKKTLKFSLTSVGDVNVNFVEMSLIGELLKLVI